MSFCSKPSSLLRHLGYSSAITYKAGYLTCTSVAISCTSMPDIGILSLIDVEQALDWSNGCRFVDTQADILDTCVVAMGNETVANNQTWFSPADNKTYTVKPIEQLLREGPATSVIIKASFTAWNKAPIEFSDDYTAEEINALTSGLAGDEGSTSDGTARRLGSSSRT